GTLRIRALEVMEVLEDAIYGIIAAFLLVGGALLLFGAAYLLVEHFTLETIKDTVVTTLDQALLVFMVAELLHTIRVTLRDRSLAAEPFLIVGLIAGIRRILILTARNEDVHDPQLFFFFWVQLLLLTLLVLTMVIAVFIWRRAFPVGERDD
ncbi:MAG: phosphate-starvation-inducible PsiE family protein, partial [Candidatus Dormibacteraeota bacterium]|nr:phosphate-starvation-inducible PsiE family protein [Candidatus Dormibacteraeota bacterium]